MVLLLLNWGGIKKKVYLLVLTCLWSRAINLQICRDLTVNNFLRAFQIHVYSYGCPERVYSDLGSQIVSAASTITDFVNDVQTKLFFAENRIRPVRFHQYFRGCSKLGSLVESCVKIVKRLIYGSVRNLILEYDELEFLMYQAVHIINRRPIAFKDGLRSNSNDEIPSPITPEILLRGHEVVSLDLVPALTTGDNRDLDWSDVNLTRHITDSYKKLQKARTYMKDLYHEQFLVKLMDQAVDSKDRFKPRSHLPLKIGDIVLLKRAYVKTNELSNGYSHEGNY